jgi:hypothetical protein
MNIFRVDNDPHIAAKCLSDKHVVKMVLESAQLLSTAHRELESPVAEKCYKKTHINHPSAIWTRESRNNYIWVLEHLNGLLREYTYRYDKIHKTAEKLPYLEQIPVFEKTDSTAMPQCMPDEFKNPNDVVSGYRAYYHEKANVMVMKWTKRRKPDWLKIT